MSRIFKAPTVQINQNNFVVNNVVHFNEELKEKNLLHRNNTFDTYDINDVDDVVGFEDSFNTFEQDVEVTEELIEESHNIIQRAELQAQEIIDNANLEAENLKEEIFNSSKKEGYEKGYNDGFKKAETEMEKKLKIELEQISLEKENIGNERIELYKEVEGEAVDVIGNILDNILNNAFSVDRSLILQLVKIGLKQTTMSDEVNIKVSTNYVDFINENIVEIKKVIGNNIKVNIIDDITLKDEECIIENELGYIKCDLETVISSLKFNLKTLYNS